MRKTNSHTLTLLKYNKILQITENNIAITDFNKTTKTVTKLQRNAYIDKADTIAIKLVSKKNATKTITMLTKTFTLTRLIQLRVN